jgi:hypothetical protein
VSRLRDTAAMLASDFRVALAGLPPQHHSQFAADVNKFLA